MNDLRDLEPWPGYWCRRHNRFETIEQAAGELTAIYMREHPEMIESVFGMKEDAST